MPTAAERGKRRGIKSDRVTVLSVFPAAPAGIVPRKDSGEDGLILDLSSPRAGSFSGINGLIPLELFPLHYAAVDNAIKLIKLAGQGAWVFKGGISSGDDGGGDALPQLNLLGIRWGLKYYSAAGRNSPSLLFDSVPNRVGVFYTHMWGLFLPAEGQKRKLWSVLGLGNVTVSHCISLGDSALSKIIVLLLNHSVSSYFCNLAQQPDPSAQLRTLPHPSCQPPTDSVPQSVLICHRIPEPIRSVYG